MALKGKTMRMVGRGIKLAFAVMVATLASGVAHAEKFATFTQIEPNNNPIRFLNTGSTSVFGTYNTSGTLISVPVNFFYTGLTFGNPIGEGSVNDGGQIQALMTISSKVSSTGSVFNATVFQPLQEIEIVFRVNDTEYASGLQNGVLLKITKTLSLPPINGTGDPQTDGSLGTTGTLSGAVAGASASLSPSESEGGPNYIGYESDFLNFNEQFSSRGFGLTISDIVPTVGPTNAPSNNGLRLGRSGSESTSYMRSFIASVEGGFSSDPLPLMVPEPTSLAFLLPVALGIGCVIRKRQR